MTDFIYTFFLVGWYPIGMRRRSMCVTYTYSFYISFIYYFFFYISKTVLVDNPIDRNKTFFLVGKLKLMSKSQRHLYEEEKKSFARESNKMKNRKLSLNTRCIDLNK